MPDCSSLYHHYYYYCNLSYTDSPQLSVYFSISVRPTFKSGAKSCEKSKLQQLRLRSQGRPWLYDSVIRAESGVLWKNNAAVEMFICIPGIFLHFLIYKIRQDSGQINALAEVCCASQWWWGERGELILPGTEGPSYHHSPHVITFLSGKHCRHHHHHQATAVCLGKNGFDWCWDFDW